MKKGFTLIEVLISITIIGIISSIFIYSLRQNVQEKKLNGIVNTIVAKLQDAKNLSQSGKNGQNYGVKFNSGSFTTFVGSTYSPSSSNNVVFPIESDFQITNTIPGSDDVIIFSKIFGEVDYYVTIIVTEKNNVNNKKTITVGRLGDISVIE